MAETGVAGTGVFGGIVGNAPALRLLSGALESGEVSHAYLFFGPPGIGKRTVAERFGAALVAGAPDADPEAEDRARRGLHPDLVSVEPEGQFTTIGQVREVVRLAASRPFEGARRVFLLRAETFNVQAANALLKTLEEPEGEAVFVLMASSREAVLPTVVSRAQAVRFDPAPVAEVERFLAGRGAEGATVAAALGRGSVGLALRYAAEDELRAVREAVFEAGLGYGDDFEARHEAAAGIVARAEAVGAAREAAVLAASEEPDRRVKESAKRAGRAARDGAVGEALELLALLHRDAAVVAADAGALVANVDRVAEIRTAVDAAPGADWAGAALLASQARVALAYNAAPEAVVEVTLSRTRRKILGLPE